MTAAGRHALPSGSLPFARAPRFTDLLVSRHGAERGRSLPFVLSAGLYALALALPSALPLVLLETMRAPAFEAPTIVFRTPRGRAGASAGPRGGRRTGPPAASTRAPATTARRVLTPLAAPVSETPATPPPLDAASTPVDSGHPRDFDEGGTGGGDGPGGGDGSGRRGTGDGCPGCTGDDSDAAGDAGGDDAVSETYPGLVPPALIESSRRQPRYPEMARQARTGGKVILSMVIARNGIPGSITVLSAPDARYGFEIAAIEAVGRWRYRPGLLGGIPVAVEATVVIEFRIDR